MSTTKRSKRHRRKRNNISDKSRIQSAKEFGERMREVEAKRKAKWAPKPDTQTASIPPKKYGR